MGSWKVLRPCVFLNEKRFIKGGASEAGLSGLTLPDEGPGQTTVPDPLHVECAPSIPHILIFLPPTALLLGARAQDEQGFPNNALERCPALHPPHNSASVLAAVTASGDSRNFSSGGQMFAMFAQISCCPVLQIVGRSANFAFFGTNNQTQVTISIDPPRVSINRQRCMRGKG